MFVGSGSKSLVNSLWDVPSDISSQIIFVGAEDDPAALMTYYQEAGCLVFPSLYESSGLPPVEAMACGCPVIASDIPALKERCRDAAIYCDPRDSESIVAAIVRMMDDAELRSKLRTLGYLRAAQLTWEQCGRYDALDCISGRCYEHKPENRTGSLANRFEVSPREGSNEGQRPIRFRDSFAG